MLDNFIKKFGGITEEYKFYDGQVILRYDVDNHVYLLETAKGLEPLPSVTTIVHIIDKSPALINWACKMMQNKLFSLVPDVSLLSNEEFQSLVIQAKSAHKEKLEEAADIGHEAHAWIEQYIKHQLGLLTEWQLIYPEKEQVQNCCIAALDWMRKHNVRWINTERKVFSRTYKYAGTMDGLALVDSCDNPACCPVKFTDRKSLVDWKSSNNLYVEYLLQTAAYQLAYEEETEDIIDDRWILRLGKEDGEFEPWHVGDQDYDDDVRAFVLCLLLYEQIHLVENRMKAHKDIMKQMKKAEADKAKQEALKIKCKNADKYKGTKLSKCLPDGSQCETCKKRYQDYQKDKIIVDKL